MNNIRILTIAAVAMLVAPSLATAQEPAKRLPLSSSPSASDYYPQPLTMAQQRAKFAADQRTLQLAWNDWIGYSPLRPNMNASYFSNGVRRYYIPSRGVLVSSGHTNGWYW